MMSSSRPRGNVGGSFSSRRGHGSQLSISDESHHITETIGTLYGDEDEATPAQDNSRPLSFIGGSAYQEQIHRPPPHHERHLQDARRPLTRSISDQPSTGGSLNHDEPRNHSNLPVRSSSQRLSTYDDGSRSPVSPGVSLRDVQADSSGSQFPLTNIENPNDIAQELSNLQALRRLSMDVGNAIDPDMPPMSLSSMPAIAPSGNDDENDPSRLLWVPARVHPELAPTEFKSFLEDRVQSIRRRSSTSLGTTEGNLMRSNSGASIGGAGSLRRTSSKLSRQIDNSGGRGASGYVDGAERLERQKSNGSQHGPELSIDELVSDPTKAVQKLSQESQGQSQPAEGGSDDMPILPMVPGMGLRRSTRTTYRKGGSLRHGERAPFSKRVAQRLQEDDSADTDGPSPIDAPKGHGLTRVQSEPISDNFSRPARPSRPIRRQKTIDEDSQPVDSTQLTNTQGFTDGHSAGRQDQLSSHALDQPFTSRGASKPTAGESLESQDSRHARSFPERSSSQGTAPQSGPEPEALIQEPPARSSRRPTPQSVSQPTSSQPSPPPQPQPQYSPKPSPSTSHHGESSGDSLTHSSTSLPGGDLTRTDNLTFIPTLSADEKKSDKKSRKDRDDDTSSISSKSGSAWKWFKGSTDDKDKKKDEAKRAKMKAAAEKAQDNARLDVIQNSIDRPSSKGRESLVLERESMDTKLQEERKKESTRKGDGKKEKDGSIFSSIFGGSKKREEKEKTSKKGQLLQPPEEPIYTPLQPDVDYNWTRFPLLEERAIYRMAHIKLANPRRPLLSQVLLSNFMYSYLAIVQAMHPQMNVPVSPQQKRLEEEARRKQQEEDYLARQQAEGDDDDGQNAFDQYNFDYHRAAVQYAESDGGQVDYVDDAQIYEDEHGTDSAANHYDYDDSSYDSSMKEYYQYQNSGGDSRRDGGRDMW